MEISNGVNGLLAGRNGRYHAWRFIHPVRKSSNYWSVRLYFRGWNYPRLKSGIQKNWMLGPAEAGSRCIRDFSLSQPIYPEIKT